MAREREEFFAAYDPEDLEQEVTVSITQRELLLVRMGLDVFLRDTNRHDHVYRALHALLRRLPASIERRAPAVGPAGLQPAGRAGRAP